MTLTFLVFVYLLIAALLFGYLTFKGEFEKVGQRALVAIKWPWLVAVMIYFWKAR